MAARAARFAAAQAAAVAAAGGGGGEPPDAAGDDAGGNEACPERLSADVFSRYVCVHAAAAAHARMRKGTALRKQHALLSAGLAPCC